MFTNSNLTSNRPSITRELWKLLLPTHGSDTDENHEEIMENVRLGGMNRRTTAGEVSFRHNKSSICVFEGSTPLILATFAERPLVVKDIVGMGADLNAVDSIGRSALHVSAAATSISNQDITNVLLANGANPNVTDSDGFTPLHKAAACGNVDDIESLIFHGAKIDYPPDTRTSLDMGLSFRHFQAVKALLSHGASINIGLPLHCVAYLAFREMAEALIDLGADVDALNEENEVPLHQASHGFYPPLVISLLVHENANLTQRSTKNRCNLTPLELYQKANRTDEGEEFYENIVRLLKC